MKVLLISFIALSGTLAASAQNGSGGYIRPMETAPLLSGTFAEMRSGHFHSGIDYRTEGREGIPVRAVADGSVVRIAYSASGYGRALYVAHGNGTTSVYAHLQRFAPEIEKYFDDERYRLRKDQVDLSPAAGKFPVRQGEVIGLSGNTGSSGGPHLHFELRETASQRPYNVLASGDMAVRDDIPPTVYRLFYIQLDTIRAVPVNSAPRDIKLRKTPDGNYTAEDSLTVLPRCGYFVVEAIDHMNGTSNRMGVYLTRMSFDGRRVFEMRRDRFLFSDTRYVNAAAHYGLNRDTPYEMIRLAVMAGNRLPMYNGVVDRGALTLNDSTPRRIEITLADEAGNSVAVNFRVRLGEYLYLPVPEGEPAYNWRPFVHNTPEAGIEIPAGTLYEPIFYTQTAEPSDGYLSPVYAFHDGSVPMHGYSTIWISAQIPHRLRDKVCLARISKDGKASYVAGSWAAPSGRLPGRVTGRVRDFGRYCVTADTIPPQITADFAPGADLSGRSSVKFTLKDDFSGVKSYNATLDGKWALLEYDPKTRTLTHPFDHRRFPRSDHSITVEVRDNAGNVTVFRSAFSTGIKKEEKR